jgi:hypothetical protein
MNAHKITDMVVWIIHCSIMSGSFFFTFAVYIQLRLMLVPLLSITYHYMFYLNWPSSSLQVAVIKERVAEL